MIVDEKTNETAWEFWLHKDFENTYDEYRNKVGLKDSADEQAPNEVDFETTIIDSMEIAKSSL